MTLNELSVFEDLPETQKTLEGNARQKALYVSEKIRIPCFADDSGLEVDALDGAPGVYSARFAGPEKDTAKNNALLLSRLDGQTNRRARFRTVIALAGFGNLQLFEGVIEGTITTSPRGMNGFGYDPLFVPDGAQQTFAEMSLIEKNALSHRAKAIQKLSDFLLRQI